MKPDFSILTPSLNQGRFIETTLRSIREQLPVAVEHIVMDGGSSDDTVTHLREFPEVIWRSEPDSGQSHALNKAFALAHGDNIGWINADDWLAPGILGEAMATLESDPVVMGWCQRHSEDGTAAELVQNESRTWFDLMKYWVHYAIPDQPAIFMRRSLLEQVARGSELLDPTLHYTMDYDLWLRIAARVPLRQSLGKIAAHARIHPASKTGRNMGALYDEARVVFDRHERIRLQGASDFSLVIIADEDRPLSSADIERSIAGLSGVQRSAIFIPAELPHGEGFTRYTVEELTRGDLTARLGRIVIFVQGGVALSPRFVAELQTLFQMPSLGGVIPWHCARELGLTEGEKAFTSIQHEALLDAHTIPGVAAFRRIVLEELRSAELSGRMLIQEYLIRARFRGWAVGCARSLEVAGSWGGPSLPEARPRIVARMRACDAQEPFAQIRMRGGFSFPL